VKRSASSAGEDHKGMRKEGKSVTPRQAAAVRVIRG